MTDLLRVIRTDPSWPKGHDVADLVSQGWDRERLWAFMKANLLTPEQFAPLVDGAIPPASAPFSSSTENAKHAQSPNGHVNGKVHRPHGYYRPLGYDRSTYFVLSHESQQVHDFTPSNARTALLSFAPLSFWEGRFLKERGGVDWPAATDEVIRECYRTGVYQPGCVRGRGVWFDQDRTVIHLGNHLLVDGKEIRTSDIDSRFIYTAKAPIGFRLVESATDEEAYLIYQTANEFLWEHGIHGPLFAGWLALAPLCGALPWRPHIWLTGGAGAGKTTLERDFMAPMLCGFPLTVQGGSTEAGIRQMLASDARPIIFDEAGDSEQLTDASRAKIKAVLDLMRASSSQQGGSMVKGSTSHQAVTFELNSAFCLSSVLVQNMSDADTSRITILRLRALTEDERKQDPQQWPRLAAKLKKVRELGPAFVARNIRNVPLIMENISLFTRLCADKLRDQRLGDQYGAMLAAAYTMLPESVRATPEQWVEELDWDEYRPDPATRDEFKCLNSVLENIIQVKDEDRGISHERSITQLTRNLADFVDGTADSHVTGVQARAALARLGMAVIRKRDKPGQYLFISNTHRALSNIFKGTRWANGWAMSLRRIPGAIANDVQETDGHTMRGVAIPLSNFMRVSDVSQPENNDGDR